MARFKWSPAADALLDASVDAGHSAAYAARLIGCDRSAAKYRAASRGKPFHASAGRVARPERRKPPPTQRTARVVAVPFLEAGNHQCAWPLVSRAEPGHQGMLVCGAARTRGSYCDHHHRRGHRLTYTQGYEAAFDGAVEELSA